MTVEPRLSTTPLTWLLHHFGHFILNRIKALTVIFFLKNPLNTPILLIQLEFRDVLVTGFTGFHCIINSRYEFSLRMKSLSWAVQRLHACSLILDARKSISKRGVLCFHLTQSLNLRKRVDLRSKIYTSFKLSLSINIIIFCREYCFLEARVPLFEFTGYNVLYQLEVSAQKRYLLKASAHKRKRTCFTSLGIYERLGKSFI